MREYNTIDKSNWGDGPWLSEPDKVQWTDESTGLPCLAVRHKESGHWCGYVGVSALHPLHGIDYDQAHRMADISCHGGLTYSAGCSHGDEATSICHVPEPGQPDDVWWLGFDCNHHRDLAPAMEAKLPRFRGHTVYRTLEYVREQCASLAGQLSQVQSNE